MIYFKNCYKFMVTLNTHPGFKSSKCHHNPSITENSKSRKTSQSSTSNTTLTQIGLILYAKYSSIELHTLGMDPQF